MSKAAELRLKYLYGAVGSLSNCETKRQSNAIKPRPGKEIEAGQLVHKELILA